ncbi:MAG TPA: response regulator [Acidimicrobiales bacterium]|nr:response regulator [Acidimicrobiales bacterium]
MSDVALTQILLVEDSAADIRLTQEALRDSKLANELSVARDGIDALAFLRREPPHEAAPRPDLVVLDLNLPRMGGREVLAAMKADPALRSIPVAVLTTSAEEADILASYELGANCYITKPLGMEQFVTIVQSIEDFWFGVVQLPPRRTT